MTNILRIATRKSPLALWQAEYVRDRLQYHHPHLSIELVTFTTRGDKILDTPLAKIGGKGLFVKELEVAMLEGRADLAVHSMKDVPMAFPDGLALTTICEREVPTDAFVSNDYGALSDLPAGAVVGTSSLRRQCQLRAQFPHLQIKDLRGNVQTRLSKLDNNEYAAILLATAGLLRLGLDNRITAQLSVEESLPAGGQGAVGIECRSDDELLHQLLAPLHHQDTADCVMAERAMNRHLEGGCQVPIACYAQCEGEELAMKGLVGSPDGETLLTATQRGQRSEAEQLGVLLAEKLLQQGAGAILQAVYASSQVT